MQTHSLMHYLYDTKGLKRAARQCMRRRSVAGIDKIKWKSYRDNFNENISKLSAKIRLGEWQPSPLRSKIIYDFTGRQLELFIPTVEDRIVHRHLRNILESIFDEFTFLDFVSGFRKGRSRLTALKQSTKYLNKRSTFVVNIDVRRVSSGVTSDEVVNWIAQYVSDGVFLKFINKILVSLPNPLCHGSGLSPLLINLRLAPIDREVKDLNVVRFADNYCFFETTFETAIQRYSFIEDILRKYNLEISKDKSGILNNQNLEDLFLI